MGKDSRLSFRITQTMSDRIDKAIDKADGQIRDRSEFGTKAIKFYLDYIENTEAEEEIILSALLALADEIGERGEEVEEVRNYLENRTLIPKTMVSKKEPESHPDFQKLLGLLDRIKEQGYMEMYEELTEKVQDALYDDIPELFQEYSDAFFLGESKAKEKKIKA